MIEFEQRRRQQLLDEDFYDYFQKILIWERKYVENSIKSIKNPFMEPMIDFYYQQLVLDYTVGKPITDLLPSMETIIKYTNDTIAHVEQHNQKHPDNPKKIIMLSEYFETEKLSNLLGLCILFERQDWFETIVKAVDF
ncbi:MAG: DUF1910 domain-containing protein, partial [Gilliamella sp.]|uniref:hypothetical protein n=1 Tax=Gilliamella sp. TaxID=1891236 RepID=UPI0025EC8A37